MEKLGNLFGGAHALPNSEMNDDDDEAPTTKALPPVAKKATVVRATKKMSKVNATGQPGAHRARLVTSKSNKRGKTKNGFSINKSKSKRVRGLAKF
jgi:hypothetical protein